MKHLSFEIAKGMKALEAFTGIMSGIFESKKMIIQTVSSHSNRDIASRGNDRWCVIQYLVIQYLVFGSQIRLKHHRTVKYALNFVMTFGCI